MRAAVIAAVVALVLVPPVVLSGTWGHALRNGDEAIYAQMARELPGHWGDLSWQGEVAFPRPPGVLWILAVAHTISDGEAAVRVPLALACAAEVALLILLGAALFNPRVGIAAGALLFASDLFLGYSRFLESEPFLCAAALAAFLAWERRRVLAWGFFLGACLMIKQFVGALPLLVLVGERPRGWWRGLFVAAIVWAPWHIYAALQHGRAFFDSYLFANVMARSTGAMLQTTRASFYLRELWRSEGVFALLAAAGLVMLWRRRALFVWALGTLVLYSLARSRYDYYLLLVYPPLWLGAAALVDKLPLRSAVAAALALTAFALHAPRNLAAFPGDDETRALVTIVNQRLTMPARLYTYNTHAYAARYYARADLELVTLLESADDERLAGELRKAGLPSKTMLAPDLAAALRALPAPFALLMPRARIELVKDAGMTAVADSAKFVLFEKR